MAPGAASRRWARALPLVFLTACGARSELDGAGAADDYALSLPAGAAPLVEGCTRPAIVPHGRAWFGFFLINSQGLSSWYEYDSVCDVGTPAHPFAVPAFFLDVDEATNGCYARCVEAGACGEPVTMNDGSPPWDGPARARWPVIVDHARAEAFCAWRHGRLPSAAELTRASHGDAESICGPGFIDSWRTCFHQKFASADCQRLHARALPENRPVEPIRSYPLDQGPFGHFDLFGSQADLTQSLPPQTDAEERAYCSTPDDAPDPRTFGAPGADPLWYQFSPSRSLAYVGHLIDMRPDAGDTYIAAERVDRDAFDHRYPYVKGVRCAYDPAR